MKGGGITTPTTIAARRKPTRFSWTAPSCATLHQRFDLPMDDVSVFAKTRALKDQF
jgi:hypothetical protein